MRYLRDLYTAGLLVRTTARHDPSHLAHYTISEPGAQALEQRLRETGRTRIPLGLGRRGHNNRTQPVANDFFVRLVAHARTTGQGHLYQWRHALDTAAWLRVHCITDARPNGDGLWIQDNTSVRFLLHIDNDRTLDQTRASSPLTRLFGYDNAPAGVPADVALVVTPTELRELRLHLELALAPFPLPVAATTRSRLNDAPSPAEPIWTISPDTDELPSLVEVARLGTTSRGRRWCVSSASVIRAPPRD